MSARHGQCRTVNMPETRRKQLALIAAHLGVRSSEEVIQAAISALMLTLAENDPGLAYGLARTAGVEWDKLERANHREVLAALGV